MRKKILTLSAALGLALAAAVPLANAQSSFSFSSSTPPPATTTVPTTTTSPAPSTTPSSPVASITDFIASARLTDIGDGVITDFTWTAQGTNIDSFNLAISVIDESSLENVNCHPDSVVGSIAIESTQRSLSITSPRNLNYGFCLNAMDTTGSVVATASIGQPQLTSDFFTSLKPETYIELGQGNYHHSWLHVSNPWDFCYQGTIVDDCGLFEPELQLSPDPTFPADTTHTLPYYAGLDLPGDTGCNYARLRFVDGGGVPSQWSDTEPYLRGYRTHTEGLTCTVE